MSVGSRDERLGSGSDQRSYSGAIFRPEFIGGTRGGSTLREPAPMHCRSPVRYIGRSVCLICTPRTTTHCPAHLPENGEHRAVRRPRVLPTSCCAGELHLALDHGLPAQRSPTDLTYVALARSARPPHLEHELTSQGLS